MEWSHFRRGSSGNELQWMGVRLAPTTSVPWCHAFEQATLNGQGRSRLLMELRLLISCH